MRPLSILTILFALCVVVPAHADQFVGVGDPLPAIDIAHFFQGDAIDSLDPNRTYVLEFWATWCGPCRAAMPHLRDLAKKYEGKVTILALSDEPVETVQGFLDKPSGTNDLTWRQLMAFPIATDPDKSVKKEIFEAAGQRGIPRSFIVSKGRVQWIGHPMSLDEPLAQVVGGTWDLAKAKQEFAEEREVSAMLEEFEPLAKGAKSSGNWDEALAFLDRCAAKKPENEQIAMTKWNVLLLGAQKYDEAYAFGKTLVKKVWDDSQALNEIAWTVVDDAKVKTRDLEFALEAAERASALEGDKDGAILDTVARVHFEAGRLDEAIRIQKLAVAHSTGELAEQLRAQLEKYEAEKAKKSGGGAGEKGKSL